MPGLPMNENLDRLKVELELFGTSHDATMADRGQPMFIITRDTGEFLALLVRATAAKQVLEIGTSNGYSTLWLAQATQAIGGRVTTVELVPNKVALAQITFERSGFSCITLVQDDAKRLLETSATHHYDLVFLDAERSEYLGWWPQIRRVLRPGGLLVVDNATSHGHQLAQLVQAVQADAHFTTCLVPIGKGEFLATKALSVDEAK